MSPRQEQRQHLRLGDNSKHCPWPSATAPPLHSPNRDGAAHSDSAGSFWSVSLMLCKFFFAAMETFQIPQLVTLFLSHWS